jgi:CBS domain-containing protein
MATVKDILREKGRHVSSVGPDATALDAALLMNEHKIGSLVVIRGERVEGIITERDILQRVVVERRDPARTRVSETMTREVVCCTEATTVDEARGVMKNRRIRHMPVVNEQRELLGLISIGDLNAHLASDQEVTIHFLHEYLYGAA